MQELLESFETFKGMCQTDGEKFIINYAISNTKLRLEKEKESLSDAFFEGQDGRYTEFDNYYVSNFGDKVEEAGI